MSTFNTIYNPSDYFSEQTYTFKPQSKFGTDWLKSWSGQAAEKTGKTDPGIFEFPAPPKTIEPGSTLDPKDYSDWIKQLGKEQTKQQILQSALGLGTGFVGGALTMPFVQRLREQDYQLGLQAMKEREMSPTAIAQRGATYQAQIAQDLSSKADYLRALAAVRTAGAQSVKKG